MFGPWPCRGSKWCGTNEAARDIEQCEIKVMLGTLTCHGGGKGGQRWSMAGLREKKRQSRTWIYWREGILHLKGVREPL